MNKKLIISLAVSFAVVAGVSIPLAIVLPKLIESRKNSGDHIHAYVTKYDKDGHWQECECGEKTEKVAHNMQKDSFTYRTCGSGDQTVYRCTDCEYVKTESGHEFLSHKFKATITTPATCAKDGTKHLECEICHQGFDVAYSALNAHNWNSGVVIGEVTTFTCLDCGKELKTLDHSQKINAEVKSTDLAQAGSIQLKEASISFDDSTLSSFSSENITISVDKVENAAASYSIVNTETKELIQDAPVFNFSLKDGEDDVHEFTGTVTVELPYVLAEGEDPDNVSIAYVPEGNGEVEYIPASYANGKVTFETTHFSLYAIVRLSAEECCAKFGHNLITGKTVPSTCVEHGHVYSCCTRCGAQPSEELPLVDHKYVFNNSVQSTATEHGYIERKCSVCGDIIREELPLIPAGDDSYALTFVKSLVDSNFEANVEMEYYELEDGEKVYDESRNLNFVFGINSEHPFMMETGTNSDGDVNYYITTTNGSYSSYDHRHYGDDGYDTVTNVLKTISAFKSQYKALDKISNVVYKVLTNTVLTKTTKDGFDYYSLDTAKLRALVQSCKTESTKVIVDKIFGDGFYAELLGIVEKFYNGKVSDLIDHLNGLGYPVKELMNLAQIFMYGNLDSEVSLYDYYFTDEVLNMTCKEFASDFVNLDEMGMGNFTTVKAVIDGFASLSPLELLTSFLGDEIDFEATAEQYIKFADEYVSNFELKTTSFGQFVSANAEVLLPYDHPIMGGDIVYTEDEAEEGHEAGAQEPFTDFRKVTVSINNNIDIAADYAIALEEIAKCEKMEKSFNRDVVIEQFEKYFESLYGVDFKYIERDDVYGRPCFESARSKEITKETALLSEEEYERYESSLRIYFYDSEHYYYKDSGSYFYYNQFNDLHDVYGKKDSNEVYCASMYFYSAEIRYDVNNESTTTIEKPVSYRLYSCYDFEKDEYFVAQEQSHRYVATAISASEFKNNARNYYGDSYIDYLVENGAKFYKITCKDCGEVSYDYSFSDNYSFGGSTFVLTKDSNAKAREYQIVINTRDKSYYYPDYINGKYVFFYNKFTTVNVSKIGSGINLPLSHLFDTENPCKDETYTFGNVSISYTYKNGSVSHEKIETITIKIDNKVYDVCVNKVHFCSDYDSRTSNETVVGCYHYYTRNLVCRDCGKTLSSTNASYADHNRVVTNTDIDTDPNDCYNWYHCHVECSKCGEVLEDYDDYTTNHNYQFRETVNSGALFEIFDVYECSKCHECYTSYRGYTEPHQVEYQYDEEQDTYLWHCEECKQNYLMDYHYVFEYMNPDYYHFNFYTGKNQEDYYCIGVRCITSYSNSWIDIDDSSWVAYVGLVSTDGEGHYDFDPDKCEQINFYRDGYVYREYEYDHYHHSNRTISAPFIAFSKDSIDGYLENKEDNEILCIFFVHRYYNGLIQIYEFPSIN